MLFILPRKSHCYLDISRQQRIGQEIIFRSLLFLPAFHRILLRMKPRMLFWIASILTCRKVRMLICLHSMRGFLISSLYYNDLHSLLWSKNRSGIHEVIYYLLKTFSVTLRYNLDRLFQAIVEHCVVFWWKQIAKVKLR